MKKLFLILLTFFALTSYGQAEFEKIALTANTASTTATKVNVQETNGEVNFVTGDNIPIPYTPVNYSASAPTTGGHYAGIDDKLGALSGTTAGISTRVWFTADQTTITAGTFDLTNPLNKGIVASHQQTVANNDDEKKYFTTDIIGQPFAAATMFPAGTYAGNLSVSTTPTNANQKFTVELYKCNNAGTPIASGVTGAPVGHLGVTVILILDSGEVTLANGSVTNLPVSANLAAGGFNVAVGERIRYHVSAEKVGTAGGVINESVYYGSSYNSFIDVPVIYNSSSIKDVSTVTNGAGTVTDALNNLNADTKSVYRSNIEVSSPSNKRNDQSSMLRLNDGRLAVTYSRFGTASADEDPASIYVKFSSDNGKTWTSGVELIPAISVSSMIPSMYKKSNGNILIVFHVQENNAIPYSSSIRKIEFNSTLTAVVTPQSTIFSTGYTAIASDRLYYDSVSSRLLMPYPILISGTGASESSIYQTKILVSSNEGTTWADSGLTINGFLGLDGFGGAIEPGIFQNKNKITVYSRNIIGSVGACDLTWSGSAYTKSTEYKLGLSAMNSQSSIKYSSFLKGWVASVTRLHTLPVGTRKQIDLSFSKDALTWNSVFTLEDIDQSGEVMALEPNIFIDERVYCTYSVSPTTDLYDLRMASFPFSNFSNTESKTFKTYTSNPTGSNANEIAISNFELTPTFNNSAYSNIVTSNISIKDNVVVSDPSNTSFYAYIPYSTIINSGSTIKNLNLGIFGVFSPQQIIDKTHVQGKMSKIHLTGFDAPSLKNGSIIDDYAAIRIPRILNVGAIGTITKKLAISQEYDGDYNYFAGKTGFGTDIPLDIVHIAGVANGLVFDTTGGLGSTRLGATESFKFSIKNGRGSTTEIKIGNEALEFLTSGVVRANISELGVFKINNLAGTGNALLQTNSIGEVSRGGALPLVYIALITQSGTSAPTATVIQNTLGVPVTWSYSSVGNYKITSSDAFTVGKTFLTITSNGNFTSSGYSPNNDDVFLITGSANGLANNLFFKIEVYP